MMMMVIQLNLFILCVSSENPYFTVKVHSRRSQSHFLTTTPHISICQQGANISQTFVKYLWNTCKIFVKSTWVCFPSVVSVLRVIPGVRVISQLSWSSKKWARKDKIYQQTNRYLRNCNFQRHQFSNFSLSTLNGKARFKKLSPQ